jgi:hypothetical protein
MAVGLVEGRGELVAGDAVDLREDALRGLGVDLFERPGAEDVLAVEELEEVELDVAQVGLVVAHLLDPLGDASGTTCG